MLRYQVDFAGQGWCPVEHGIVLIDGRLAWWRGTEKGIAPAQYWMLADSTLRHPAFRAACWDGLSAEERAAALARMSVQAKAA